MRKLIAVLFITLIALNLISCATTSGKAGNSPDEQRSHAQNAQDELSLEVHK